MPVSHLGLTVSHIPSATAFYEAALAPLGYHYIGYRGDSIGFGIFEADFFIRQETNGQRIAPTHIAFAAEDRPAVRTCYAAALNAGATPSGSPGYREDDCSCFNAAVVDLDGNTIEFIHRDPCTSSPSARHFEPDSHHSQYSRRSGSPETTSRKSMREDVRSEDSRTSRAKSRYQTALDLASATSKSMRQGEVPRPGITRTQTDPLQFGADGKAVMGTIMGAAAGAAFVYAMCNTERSNAREEVEYAASIRSKDRRPQPESSPSSKTPHRNFSVTESHATRRYPPSSLSRAMPRAIEATARREDDLIEPSRYSSARRPLLPRSKTHDGSAYVTEGDRYSSHSQRSRTPPLQHTIDERSTASSSRHPSRRGSFDEPRVKRHDSVVGGGTATRSHLSRRQSDAGRSSSSANTIRASSRRGSAAAVYPNAEEVPLPASRATTAYMSSVHGGPEDVARASTAYVTAVHSSADAVPLPPSRATTTYLSAAQVSLPPSRLSASSSRPSTAYSQHDGSSRVTARNLAALAAANPERAPEAPEPPRPMPRESYDDQLPRSGGEGDESEGFGDEGSIVPEDSISCIDGPAHMRASERAAGPASAAVAGSSRSSRHSGKSSRRSEAAASDRTVRHVPQSKERSTTGRSHHTGVTVPIRSKGRAGGEEERYRRSSHIG